jgi:putative aldouronate transport system substrate-binding protein
LIAGWGRAAVVGLLGVPVAIGGCSVAVTPFASTAPSTPSTARVGLPAFIPAQGPPPDYPGTADGVDPGYVRFPGTRFKSVSATPSNGGQFTGLYATTGSPPPPPPDQNPAWQQLNQRLGGTLLLLGVPQADYAPKWASITAGGDLPDVMNIIPSPILPGVPQFAKALCADLTPYLSGEAIKGYPNLANFPTASWRVGILNNAIYGIPIVRSLTGVMMFVQQNLVDAIGGTPLKTADDFKQLCKALTNAQANKWAIGMTNDNTAGPYAMWFFQGIFTAPNNWRRDTSGSLAKDIETEEYRSAVGFVRDLVGAGYVSPDVKTNVDLNNDFLGGKVAMRANAWINYQQAYASASAQLKINIRAIPPLAADSSSKPGHILSSGSFGYSLLKGGSPDRIQEVLRVLNFLAAPFGSEEYMVNRFGVQGVDYNFDDQGNPTFTPQGLKDIPGSPSPGQNWGHLAAPAVVSYSADSPEFGQYGHAEQAAYIAVGIADPTVGLTSPTAQDKGAHLDQLIFDRVTDIAAGRSPLSDLDQLVKDWRAQGGDQIRAEFQQVLQAG